MKICSTLKYLEAKHGATDSGVLLLILFYSRAKENMERKRPFPVPVPIPSFPHILE